MRRNQRGGVNAAAAGGSGAHTIAGFAINADGSLSANLRATWPVFEMQ